MRYLILGGNGFIGSHLVDALINNGHHVRVFDRNATDRRIESEYFEQVTGDFTDVISLTEALSDIDVVYHLISTTVPSTSNINMVNDVESNLISTLQLLEAMLNMDVKRLVFFSSGGTVYGNPISNPISEVHPLNPICSYGVVKVAIENYLYLYHKLHDFQYNILRVSNPYGGNQQRFGVQGVISTFLYKALKNEKINVWGDGSIERDYIYIDDLIDVSVKAGIQMHNSVFNIGTGILTSINTIIQTIETVTNKTIKINKLPAREFDVKSVALNNERAVNQFDWEPNCNLKEGISKNWEWLCKNYN